MARRALGFGEKTQKDGNNLQAPGSAVVITADQMVSLFDRLNDASTAVSSHINPPEQRPPCMPSLNKDPDLARPVLVAVCASFCKLIRNGPEQAEVSENRRCARVRPPDRQSPNG